MERVAESEAEYEWRLRQGGKGEAVSGKSESGEEKAAIAGVEAAGEIDRKKQGLHEVRGRLLRQQKKD